jgi:hypothetical protein
MRNEPPDPEIVLESGTRSFNPGIEENAG